jgi:hypothetical protein
VFGLLPKHTLPIFWSWPKDWSLFGWLPIFWFANAPIPTLLHFFSQCWPTCRQGIAQPKFWLANILVGQSWAQTKQAL